MGHPNSWLAYLLSGYCLGSRELYNIINLNNYEGYHGKDHQANSADPRKDREDIVCEFCGKKGGVAKDCFLNPNSAK